MKKLSFFALSLTLFTGVVSCSKDNEEPTPATKTKTELLTAKNWRLTAEQMTMVSGGKTTTEDHFKDYEACEKDDFYKFNPDKSLIADQGATKCSSSANEPQSEKGTWDFNSDQTKLTFSADGPLGITFNIAELTATTLKITYSQTQDTDGDGKEDTTITYTQTFTAF